MKIIMKNNGLNILNKDAPADFKAVSSLLSPKLPNVIIDDNNMESGKAKGIILADT